MNTIPRKTLKAPPLRPFIINKYNCPSSAVEKHVLGALVKCRGILYNPNFKPTKADITSKEKEINYKTNFILNEIMSGPNCPKELQDLNCTVFFLTKVVPVRLEAFQSISSTSSPYVYSLKSSKSMLLP